ncbi:ca2 :cation antiporter family [Plasmopara halstedii]|uniref:Ca2: cation antiporter family n=1 Tax=Plasmopara halstedii TaxID=4781 RepID=A0A0P1B3U9_PLAHL|nr:ca2 :cation antiporter family [Plasmopara halstedii]CEG48919.1 ca2 :cation antiporter family [Plasmopara halstedii]|eukprot:XP_024585288.1 ca2 :cation antiporter family [Plasmopara halstedii]
MHTAQALASIRRARTNDTEGGTSRVRKYPSEHSSLLHGHGHSGSNGHVSSMGYQLSSGATSSDFNDKPLSLKEDLHAIYDMIKQQPLNLLLLSAPLAIWASIGGWSDMWVFVFNFLVMIPLANLLGEATESLAFHTGETIGGLVNATFGNAVEVIVAIFALNAGEISVVQSSLIGSVLSNLLLVLGCAFIAGGLHNKESSFNAVGASANSSLLMLASFAMLLPSYIFYFSDNDSEETRVANTLILSRIAAAFLLFMYLQLLYFQLKTHADFFEDVQDDSEETVALSMRASAVVLLLATLLVSLFSQFLVNSIDGFATQLHLSKSFIGIILLPVVGNAVEHVTAVKVALNNKMELAMGVAVGSATQVSLFVVPVVVLSGWFMDRAMSLAFPQFEILIYLMSIIIVYAIIADGKSNWLEGSMLLTAYALVAIALVWVEVPTTE